MYEFQRSEWGTRLTAQCCRCGPIFLMTDGNCSICGMHPHEEGPRYYDRAAGVFMKEE